MHAIQEASITPSRTKRTALQASRDVDVVQYALDDLPRRNAIVMILDVCSMLS